MAKKEVNQDPPKTYKLKKLAKKVKKSHIGTGDGGVLSKKGISTAK